MRPEMEAPLASLRDAARGVAKAAAACKLEGLDVEEYVESFSPGGLPPSRTLCACSVRASVYVESFSQGGWEWEGLAPLRARCVRPWPTPGRLRERAWHGSLGPRGRGGLQGSSAGRRQLGPLPPCALRPSWSMIVASTLRRDQALRASAQRGFCGVVSTVPMHRPRALPSFAPRPAIYTQP